jgi:hypothetical protein
VMDEDVYEVTLSRKQYDDLLARLREAEEIARMHAPECKTRIAELEQENERLREFLRLTEYADEAWPKEDK